MTARLAATKYHLDIGPNKASQLVVLARSDHTRDGAETELRPSARLQSHKWPRTLFFIMGTLPAAIKLASLTGVPWTKLWGMMFVTSFIAIGLITFLSRTSDPTENTSISAILDIDLVENEQGVLQGQVLRAKVARLSRRVELAELFLFCLVLLAHASLITWTLKMLWSLYLETVKISQNIQDTIIFGKAALGLLMILSFLIVVVWHILRRYISLPEVATLNLVPNWLLKAFFVSVFLPGKKLFSQKTSPPPTISPSLRYVESVRDYISIWCYLLAFFHTFYWILHSICKRWPIVARALLLEPNKRDASNAEPWWRDLRAAFEEGEPIEYRAWMSFYFFLVNLAVCVLWYAFMYDSTGTVNPSWTDVFG
jgi:hypothetical protein